VFGSGRRSPSPERVVILIAGLGDFRYGHLLNIYEGGLAKDGFYTKLIDCPWIEREPCGRVTLSEAFDFIEQARTP